MGRHVWYPSGLNPVFGNVYVLLVGPPATRKTTAMQLASKIVSDNTEVNYAPNDTAGQRQGLLAALGAEEAANEQALDDGGFKLSDEDRRTLGWDGDSNNPDKHAIFITASEWGSFVGQGNLELTRFLGELYDGVPYTYQLKKIKAVLQSPIVTMIGCTTPTEISVLLPPEAIGQGFMSRIVLVYAPRKKRSIEEPELRRELMPHLTNTIQWIWRTARGEMTRSPDAKEFMSELYDKEIHINDSRFTHYTDRRHTHLKKITSIMACLRQSMTIEIRDVEDAHALLSHTEKFMPEALGEYGLSPLAKAKQRMLEFLKHSNHPVSEHTLWYVMQRDMRKVDFREALNDMLNAGKVAEVQSADGVMLVVPQDLSGLLEFVSEPQKPASDGVDLLLAQFNQELI